MAKQQNSEEQRLRKARRKMARVARIENKRAAQQDNLKQQWQEWAAKFTNNEEALAEGIWACEQLARDLEAFTRSQAAKYYLSLVEPETNEDLSRLVQFNQLKNLWLTRNHSNTLSVKSLPFNKPAYSYQFGLEEFWYETFFSDFERVQLYLYELNIRERHYILFSDQAPTVSYTAEESSHYYGKHLALEEKQRIGKSFGSLVPVVEWGAREFWRKHWSKKENRLIVANQENKDFDRPR